jgi:hypothetical protein
MFPVPLTPDALDCRSFAHPERRGPGGVSPFMANLRRKLECDLTHPEHLITETGVGYRLVIDPDAIQSSEVAKAPV